MLEKRDLKASERGFSDRLTKELRGWNKIGRLRGDSCPIGPDASDHRKAPETKTIVFPTLSQMLMEVNSNEAEWLTEVEDPDKLSSDPVSTAASSISRLAEDLGEKTTLACCQPIIAECVRASDNAQ